MTAWIQFMIFVFGAIFWWKYGGLDRQEGTKSGPIGVGQASQPTKQKKLQKMQKMPLK